MKYILTIDDDEALCKLVKKMYRNGASSRIYFSAWGGCAFLLLSESE